MAFNDLLFTPGKDNLAGVATEIWACPISDIESVPALSAVNSLKLAAAADIVCKTGKKFTRIYNTDETAKCETKNVGPRDGKARESMLTYRYPGDDIAVEEHISDWQNSPAVIIFKHKATGKLRVMGITRFDKATTVTALDIPCYFEQGDSSTGEKVADEHGTLFGWRFAAGHGPLEYQGDVPLVAAP